MKVFGLIGYPLNHSFSKRYFEEKFRRENISECSYQLFPLKKIDELPLLIHSTPGLKGLNVTIPYKESVVQFLDEIDDEAKEIGAVNCIKIDRGRLEGFNTDAYGFEISLKRFFKLPNENALAESFQAFILGTGGSSKAVAYVLKKMGLPFIKVSRQPGEGRITYNKVEANMKTFNLFINTTPVGMYPDVNQLPLVPYSRLSSNDFLFDLIYNPSETLFLQSGKSQNTHVKRGQEMFELQAEKSWMIWNG